MPAQTEAGQAIYTKPVLASYDLFVLWFSNRFIWRCPSRHLLAHYNKHVTSNHLDIGVGTGYFLDRCRFPAPRPRLALMDLNPNCLAAASRRLARYQPEIHRANILDQIPLNSPKFDSIGLNYVLHCLPGTMQSKGAVFKHLKPLLNPGGILFGSTILHDDVKRGWPARRLMALYNSKGVFSNAADSVAGLQAVLSGHLNEVTISIVGSVAIFSARAKSELGSNTARVANA